MTTSQEPAAAPGMMGCPLVAIGAALGGPAAGPGYVPAHAAKP